MSKNFFIKIKITSLAYCVLFFYKLAICSKQILLKSDGVFNALWVRKTEFPII